MKKIVRLTEADLTRIVNRVISEQLGLLSTELDDGGALGNLQKSMDRCMDQKSASELVLEIFKESKKVQGQPSQSDQKIKNWVSRINKSMEGAGITNDFTKVLSEIKTHQELGSVLNAYYNTYKRYLYKDLSGEYTISWSTIYNIIKKFMGPLKIQWCRKWSQKSNWT